MYATTSFTDLAGILSTARVWLADSEYGDLAWYVVAALGGAVAIWKVCAAGLRGTAAAWGLAKRLSPWWGDSELCAAVTGAIGRPGGAWDPATREFVSGGLTVQTSLYKDGRVGAKGIHADKREVGCELTPGELRKVEAALGKAITRHERQAVEARRADALAQVLRGRDRA